MSIMERKKQRDAILQDIKKWADQLEDPQNHTIDESCSNISVVGMTYAGKTTLIRDDVIEFGKNSWEYNNRVAFVYVDAKNEYQAKDTESILCDIRNELHKKGIRTDAFDLAWVYSVERKNRSNRRELLNDVEKEEECARSLYSSLTAKGSSLLNQVAKDSLEQAIEHSSTVFDLFGTWLHSVLGKDLSASIQENTFNLAADALKERHLADGGFFTALEKQDYRAIKKRLVAFLQLDIYINEELVNKDKSKHVCVVIDSAELLCSRHGVVYSARHPFARLARDSFMFTIFVGTALPKSFGGVSLNLDIVDKETAYDFLKKSGVNRLEDCRAIYSFSHGNAGIMCLALNVVPDISDWISNRPEHLRNQDVWDVDELVNEILDKQLGDMDVSLKDALYEICWLPSWNKDLVNIVFENNSEVRKKFDNLIELPYVNPTQSERYEIDPTVESCLRMSCTQSVAEVCLEFLQETEEFERDVLMARILLRSKLIRDIVVKYTER